MTQFAFLILAGESYILTLSETYFIYLLIFVFNVYSCFACKYVCAHVFLVPSEDSRGCWIPWDGADVRCHVDCGNWTWDLWKRNKCCYPLTHLSNSQNYFKENLILDIFLPAQINMIFDHDQPFLINLYQWEHQWTPVTRQCVCGSYAVYNSHTH